MSKASTAATPIGGLICFEGLWETSLKSRVSVKNALQCLEDIGVAKVLHRDVSTKEELKFLVDQWLGSSGRAMREYGLGMFEFHGTRKTLGLDNGEVSLDELATMISGRAAGRIIYIGGCNVLDVRDDDLTRFCRETKAKGVVGYTRVVSFVPTMAFEMILIDAIMQAKSFRPVFNRLRRQHPVLTTEIGLRMASNDWASPRRLSTAAP